MAPRWLYAVALVASVLSTAYSWDSSCSRYPDAALCAPGILAPASLSFPLSFVLPRPWPSWAGFTTTTGFAALASLAAWLLIRRIAPERIKLWQFLVSLFIWPAASFALVWVVMVGGAFVYRFTHGG